MKTNRQRFFEIYKLPSNYSPSLEDLSKLTKVPLKYLTEVYNRGRGAWETNIRSVRVLGSFKKDPDLRRYPRSARLSPEQWGFARVYSFLVHGTTYHTADRDIAEKILEEKSRRQ